MVVVEDREPLREVSGEGEIFGFVVPGREHVVVGGRRQESEVTLGPARVPPMIGIAQVTTAIRVGDGVPPDHVVGGDRTVRTVEHGLIVRVDRKELSVLRPAGVNVLLMISEPPEPVIERTVLAHHDHDRVDRRVRRGAIEDRGRRLVARREQCATAR